MADEWWEIPVEDEGCDEMYDDMFASNLWKSTDTYDNETDASPIHQSPCLGLASQRDRSHLKMPPHIIALLKPEDLRRLKYQKESCKASTVNSERITITIGYNKNQETNANCKLTNVRRDDVVPAIPCIVPNIPVCSPTTEQKENENDEGANTPSTNLSPIASTLHPDKMKINTECDKKQNVTESTDVLDAVPNTKKSKLPSSRTDLRLDDLALQPNNTTKFQCQSSSGSSSPAPFVNNARRPSINSAIVPMHYVQPNASTMYMMPPPTVMPLPFCPEMHPNPTTKMVAPPGFSAVCGPPLHIGHWPSNSAGPYLNPNAAPFMHNFNRYPMPNMAIGRQGPLTNQVPPNTATITELKHDTGVVVENAKHVIMFDNLPLTIDETELRKKLEGFGKIAHVQVIKKGTSCTAFARVTDLSMAVWIVSTLDESLVDGLPMRVWIKK